MASSYASHVQTKTTPQSQAVRGKNQVRNNAGGFTFQVTPWTRLERFLILGHEGGTYYAGSRKLTYETVDCIDDCLREDDFEISAGEEIGPDFIVGAEHADDEKQAQQRA